MTQTANKSENRVRINYTTMCTSLLIVLWLLTTLVNAQKPWQGVKVEVFGDSKQLGTVKEYGERTESRGKKGENDVNVVVVGDTEELIVKGCSSFPGEKTAKNCKELLDQGTYLSGWYTIYPPTGSPMTVLCDMETDRGGWIVFQRRMDGSVDFYRDWNSYKRGFGNQWSEFWLGNDNIYLLTSNGTFELRVDLTDFDNNKTHAAYRNFSITDESKNYTLRLESFKGGDAGDSLFRVHNNRAFTTKDMDNDKASNYNCAVGYKGAWWYNSCHDSNLNGLYLKGENNRKGEGVNWSSLKPSIYSFKVSEMKFRPQT